MASTSTSSAFSLQDFIAALNTASSAPSSSRSQDYTSHLRSLLLLPRSALPAELLRQACQEYLDLTVFSELNASGGGLVVGRTTLTSFDETIKQFGSGSSKGGSGGDEVMNEGSAVGDSEEALPAIRDEETQKDVLEMALEKVQPRVLSFEDQASAIRLHLADINEALQDWSAAATVLQGIPLDSGHRSVSDLQKLRIYVRIVRLLLEADDAIGADAYLKRASMVVHSIPGTSIGYQAMNRSEEDTAVKASDEEIKEGKVLGLQYKLCQARIYDAQRRFADAAVRFHELSYVAEIDEEERSMMLSAAVTAAILAPAGPQRSRILSTLIRDDRTSALPQSTILTKVFLEHIVRPHEVDAFAEMVQPHQKTQLTRSGNDREMMRVEQEAAATTTADNAGASSMDSSPHPPNAGAGQATGTPVKSAPTTVLDRAMMEHNILASSKLYLSLTLSGLGSLLSLTPTGAETMVRRMIVQGRLKAEIDQVEGILTFLESSQQGPTAGGLGDVSGGAGGEAGEGTAPGGEGLGGLGGSGGDLPVRLGEGDGLIRRWDSHIARTASSLEDVCVRIGALSSPAPAPAAAN